MKHKARAVALATLAATALLCAHGWRAKEDAPPFLPADLSALPPLQTGDWVLRAGTDTDSHIIRQAGGGEFSHIGMVVATSPEILVIHATTDERQQTPSDGVLLTPLTAFFAPDRTQKYAVIRPQFLSDAQKQAIAQALYAKINQAFVLSERNDDKHLYCTTLLADAIGAVSADFAPRWQRISVPVFKGEYLFPDAFVGYPQTQIVYQGAYESAQPTTSGKQ